MFMMDTTTGWFATLGNYLIWAVFVIIGWFFVELMKLKVEVAKLRMRIEEEASRIKDWRDAFNSLEKLVREIDRKVTWMAAKMNGENQS